MLETSSISRRRFAQLFGAGTAYAVARGSSLAGPLTEARLARPAAHLSVMPGVVRLSSNENPYGPSPMALKAMTDAFGLAWRYPDEHTDLLIETLAKVNRVNRDQILLGDGSGEILKLCAAAFTGPLTADNDRPVTLARPTRGGALDFRPGRGRLVVADPTFEAILNHATINRAEVVKVPLTSSFSHDLPKMLSAASEGLIYICNPNNPTASLTPKTEVREFIAKVPRQTMILVDEAYFHYADSSDYETVIPLIKDYPNLIVARTFSKIYGMAGLRCGYCVAQPETIQRLRPHQTWDSINIMALAAAIASLNDPDQVANGRRMNSQTKMFVSGELGALGYKHIPSQANFLMVDVKRPVRPMIQALGQRGVQVGRVFPALPSYLRVTVGKRPEMETFLTAFRQIAGNA
ncbi:MAG: pyridoxal phosphate-dependent aminotransferase [Acidobacteriota bacterium]